MKANEICSEVYGMSGFGTVSSYQNGDIDDKLIFALLRRVARDISKYRWQELIRTGRITISAGTNSYNLPNDFREMIPNSMRAIDDVRTIDFPAPIETWAHLDTNAGATGVSKRLRLQDGKIVVPANQSDNYTIRFDYISNFPVADADGNRIKTFERDDDVWLLDEDLIIKGLKVKWSIEKGLETLNADMGDYGAYVNELKGTQAGSRRISTSGSGIYVPSAPHINTWR